MDYNTAYLWITDNASHEEREYFEALDSEDEAIMFAESLGAYDPLEDWGEPEED